MTFDQWFEGKYPAQRYGHDAELIQMREEYREVWDVALEQAENIFKQYTWGPYKSPAITIQEMRQHAAGGRIEKEEP